MKVICITSFRYIGTITFTKNLKIVSLATDTNESEQEMSTFDRYALPQTNVIIQFKHFSDIFNKN